MAYVPDGSPFSERGGRLRGAIDLVAGRYPPFLFGFDIGRMLPVFHFHETTVAHLEPAFAYLVENGYRSAGADDMAALVRRGTLPPPKSVVLAFDDALASLWMVAAPLLRKYGLCAVAYAIPGRVQDAPGVRPTIDDGPVDADAADNAPNPFCTWPELRALASSGVIDVQSHTWSHSMIFSGHAPLEVTRPATDGEYPMNRPRLNVDDPPVFLAPGRYGFPLFARRSRMSDARRFIPDAGSVAAVEAFVADRGGALFFSTANWQATIAPILGKVAGRWESDAETAEAIEHELVAAKDTLEAQLKTPVRHMCMPWGITGRRTQAALARLGFETSVANRWPGMYAVRAGDDPFFLTRLPNRHIFALPGRGRRAFRTLA